MTTTRFGKVTCYAALSLAAVIWAVWTVKPLLEAEMPVGAYLRSDILLFIAGCTLTGIGVYAWFSYIRHHREHRADFWFFLIFGVLTLLFTVIVVIRFGGITEENFDPSSAAMIDLNLMAAGAIPVPLLARTWILVPGCESGAKRWIGAAEAAIAAGAYVWMIAAGILLHTVSYTG